VKNSTSLMLWLAAADPARVQKLPVKERHRLVAAGGAVLATSTMAFIGGTYLFASIFHVFVLLAFVLGAGFALMIMNLERAIQASLVRQSNPGLTALQAAPRVALAYLMGLLISVVLMLLAFSPEITDQVPRDRRAQAGRDLRALDVTYADIPTLKAEEDTIESKIQSFTPGKILKTSPEYVALGRRISRLEQWVRTTSDTKLVRSYQRRLNTLAPQIHALREKLLAQEQTVADAGRTAQQTRLTNVQTTLHSRQAQRQQADAEIDERQHAMVGLSDRINALDHLANRDGATAWMRRVLMLILLAVDCSPALILTGSLLGRKSLYEQQEDAEEAKLLQELEIQREAHEEASRRQAEVHVTAYEELFRERLDRQIKLQREFDQIYNDEVGKLVGPAAREAAQRAAHEYFGPQPERQAQAEAPSVDEPNETSARPRLPRLRRPAWLRRRGLIGPEVG
jgi:hypothetical protein